MKGCTPNQRAVSRLPFHLTAAIKSQLGRHLAQYQSVWACLTCHPHAKHLWHSTMNTIPQSGGGCPPTQA